MGDLTRFSKPTFWLFWMASLCIRIYNVIIYCSSPWIHKVWILYTYSIQISVMLQFQSPLMLILHVLISNFVSVIVLSLGFNFHKERSMCWDIQLEIRINLTTIKFRSNCYIQTIEKLFKICKAKQINKGKNCYDILKTQINGMDLIFK